MQRDCLFVGQPGHGDHLNQRNADVCFRVKSGHPSQSSERFSICSSGPAGKRSGYPMVRVKPRCNLAHILPLWRPVAAKLVLLKVMLAGLYLNPLGIRRQSTEHYLQQGVIPTQKQTPDQPDEPDAPGARSYPVRFWSFYSGVGLSFANILQSRFTMKVFSDTSQGGRDFSNDSKQSHARRFPKSIITDQGHHLRDDHYR